MKKALLLLAVCLFLKPIAFAGTIIFPVLNDQLEEATDVVVGTFKENKGQIIFVVEKALKGEAKLADNFSITINSELGWNLLIGGGKQAPEESELVNRFNGNDWLNKRLVILGEVNEGVWTSNCYDHSLWFNGASTAEDEYKELSLAELIKVLEEKLVEEEDER